MARTPLEGDVGHDLPDVLSIEAARVRYPTPLRRYVGKELVETAEAVELLVRTTAALPIRGITPVLFIGKAVVPDYHIAGANLYRFFLFDFERVASGAPIALGWPYAPKSARLTNFRYKIRGNLPVA